jgi:hypothetical protein
VDPDNTIYDSRDGCNAIIETATNTLVVGCKDTKIPSSVEEIGDGAFGFCMELTEITIPESVLTIGENAFCCCESLRFLSIPDRIKSIGDDAFSGCKSLPVEDNVRYVGNILLEVVDESLTKCKIKEDTHFIFNEAFSMCTKLVSIDIPNSVVGIGAEAFSDCSSLVSVRLPNRIKRIRDNTFYGCSALESIVIPDSVTSIGCSAFEDCMSLQTVHLSDNLKVIEADAFSGCRSLTSVQLPSQLKEIWSRAFRDCTSLKEIIIPENVKTVDGKSFYGCSSLTSVVLGDNIEEIRIAAFSCTPLTSISLPDSLLKIGEYAFARCNYLRTINIPQKTESIGYGVFEDCSNLKEIHIQVKNPAVADPKIGEKSIISNENVICFNTQIFIHSKAFSNIDFNKVTLYIPSGVEKAYKAHPAFQEFKSIKTEDLFDSVALFSFDDDGETISSVRDLLRSSIIIPNTVVRIDNLAFNGCSELENITIPASILAIGNDIFDGCKKLSTIKVASDNPVYDSRNDCNAIIETDTNSLVAGCGSSVIPDSVTSIACYAFKGSALETITIPASIIRIGQDAFRNCSKLQEIHIQVAMPNKLVIRANEFKGVDFDSCILFVPRGCQDAYRSHPAFCQFKDIRVDN